MIAIVAALSFLVAGFSAVQVSAPNCRDDNGVDRCTDEQQRRMRALFGVRSIEEHRAAGDQVRRVFYVDGYGRDFILIAFVRAPGRDPTLWVHFRPVEGEPRPEPLQASVSQAAWDEIIDRSVNFDRTYAPRLGDTGPCLHGWVYTIESVGRRQGRLPAEIRRKTESACENGPGGAYAREVQRIALALIPHCSALDPRHHRNPASMLDACRILHGDRMAAAEVLNLAEAFQSISGPRDEPRLAAVFGHEPRIDWNGNRYQGSGTGAAAFWAGRLEQASGWTNFHFRSVEAETADRARLMGMLSRSADTPRGRSTGSEHARVQLVWVRDFNGDMKVESATVGPWEGD